MRTRALPTAVIASAVAHGALVLWVGLREPERAIEPALAPPAVAIEVVPPAEPVAFDLLDASEVATVTGRDASAGIAATARSVETRGRGIRPGHAQEPTTAPPVTGKLKMRKPEPAGLSPEFIADFLARTKPLPEVPDLPGARIEAEISDLRGKLSNPRFIANASPDELAGMRNALVGLAEARKQVELKPQRDGTYRTDKETFVAHVGADGKVRFQDKRNLQHDGGLNLKFDVTEAAMRAYSMDPYASAKLRYLDRTRDQRVEIGRKYQREQLARSAEYAEGNVQRLWASTTELAKRKQGLFDLWDECEESGDAARVAGGAAARAFLISFIQVKLTGRNAYTAQEIARLNKGRRSRAAFVPY